MSKYDWESGSIIIPAAAVAGLKKALRDWTNTFHTDVRAEAVRLHKTVLKGTRSARLYQERLSTVVEAPITDQWGRNPQNYTTMVRSAAKQVLEGILRQHERNQSPLRQPTVTDVERAAKRATNRTDRFAVITLSGYAEAGISFDGRTVRWSVPENNHAVEAAHDAPIAGVFFTALNRITWTRSTGGHFVGNDEYNRDNDNHGGGANYLTSTYGPLGNDAKIDDYMSRGFSKKQATEIVNGR